MSSIIKVGAKEREEARKAEEAAEELRMQQKIQQGNLTSVS